MHYLLGSQSTVSASWLKRILQLWNRNFEDKNEGLCESARRDGLHSPASRLQTPHWLLGGLTLETTLDRIHFITL